MNLYRKLVYNGSSAFWKCEGVYDEEVTLLELIFNFIQKMRLTYGIVFL